MSTSDLGELQKLLEQIDKKRDALIGDIERLQKVSQNPYHAYTTGFTFELPESQCENEFTRATFANEHRETIKYNKQYSLITLTFDPSVSRRLTAEEQKQSLIYCFKQFKNKHIFACVEKHRSGILHGHIMCIIDPAEQFEIIKKFQSRLTPSRKTYPAIKVDLVKQTKADYLRTYDYIVKDKPDHPKYKYLFFNP
jgi:hypothetical protein